MQNEKEKEKKKRLFSCDSICKEHKPKEKNQPKRQVY